MLQVEAYSAIGGRSKNEDNITGWHKGDNMCFLVADGLGGHGDGDLASKEAINVIRTAWDGEISPAAWEHLLELSHKRIRQIQTSRAQMKTTIVGLMMNTERAVWAHVGDSRLYHFLNGHLVFRRRITAHHRLRSCWARSHQHKFAPAKIVQRS